MGFLVAKKNNSKNLQLILGIAITIAVFLIIPNKDITNRYMMKVINEGFIYFIAVLGLSVMLGMGGQVTFSTAGIMGIGAYICAILTTRHNVSPILALIVALIACTLFSVVAGLALFRLKGSYFSFASIGLTQLLYTIMSNWMEVTGGPDGINKIPALGIGSLKCESYYDYFRVYFVIALICGFIVWRIRKTYLGRALASVRDNELAAQCLGINAYRTKVISFIIAGIFAGFAGGLYTFQAGYISPDLFKYDRSAIYLIMVMLGGVDSTVGALIGSVLLTILPEKMRFLSDYYQLVYGVGVIILMVVMPMGIMGMVNILRQKIRKRIKKLNNTKNVQAVEEVTANE